jgi:hypothetical protein
VFLPQVSHWDGQFHVYGTLLDPYSHTSPPSCPVYCALWVPHVRQVCFPPSCLSLTSTSDHAITICCFEAPLTRRLVDVVKPTPTMLGGGRVGTTKRRAACHLSKTTGDRPRIVVPARGTFNAVPTCFRAEFDSGLELGVGKRGCMWHVSGTFRYVPIAVYRPTLLLLPWPLPPRFCLLGQAFSLHLKLNTASYCYLLCPIRPWSGPCPSRISYATSLAWPLRRLVAACQRTGALLHVPEQFDVLPHVQAVPQSS